MLAILASSCFKKDEMVQPHSQGNVLTDTIAMTQNYKYQVWFSLVSGKAESSNIRTSSDLAFDCSPDGWKIILNTADFMKAADLGNVSFGQAQDTTGRSWRFDKSDGNPDSLAIGEWFTTSKGDTLTNGHVYAIDRGMDENGNRLGMIQFIADSLKDGTFYFRFAKLNGQDPVSASVAKDASVSYLYYSFASGGQVIKNEPAKNSWDLVFTQYSTLLFTDQGEPYPYLVTGVLLNRYNVLAALDTIHDFSSITIETAMNTTLTGALDAIGYDWKKYDFNAGSYTVIPRMNYIIRAEDGFYFKLRFIGFYNSSGEKGYPVIEYQKL